jgi:ornithine cyclodeaminase
MRLLTVAADDLPKVLPMAEAVEAMKAAFAALSTGHVAAPQRAVVPIADSGGTTLLMGAYVPDRGLAAKTVSIFDRNRDLGKPVVSGLVLVLDPDSGEPVGLLDGGALTAWRTGAACGAATDLLARRSVRRGALIGAGVQARTQLLAMDTVRDLETIRVHSLDARQVEDFIDRLQPEVRASLEPAASADAAIEEADIGTFTLDRRELDHVTVGRSTVFVDLVQAARKEAGELMAAVERGVTTPDDWTEIGLVAAGKAIGRRSEEEITLFKSVGHAVQDVVAASDAMRRAREAGLAREVEL